MKKYIFGIFILMFLSNCKIDLKENQTNQQLMTWQYTQGDGKWRKSFSPECIQTSLKRDTLISDYFYRNTFSQLKWLDTVSWEYKTNIEINSDIADEHYELNFSEITGIADVFINDKFLFRSNNSLRSWNFDITSFLSKGNNVLKLKFIAFNKAKAEKLKQSKIQLPFSGYEKLRMPKFFIDTSIGIYCIPVGITGNVNLKMWNKAKINNVYFQLIELKKDDFAKIKITYNITSDKDYNLQLQIKNKSKVIIDKKLNVDEGTNDYSCEIVLKNPKLWWTHDLGEPYLYSFTSSFYHKDELIEEFTNNYGIKTVKIDTTEHGFNFYLNEVPLTLKIIDYYPLNIFKEKILPVDFIKAVDDIVFCGINMIHVREEGYYEQKYFYEECDKSGVLVWQDFMLPFKIVDTSENFLENIKEESSNAVIQLRSYTCLAFWSGQNFFEDQINKYKNKIQAQDIPLFKTTNKKIFSDILPNLVNKLDSGRYYFEKMDFVTIAKIQTIQPEYPHIVTLRKITQDNDRILENPMLKNYQRPFNSDTLINIQKNNLGINIADISAFIYGSQVFSSKEIEKNLRNAILSSKFNGYICGIYKDFTPVISRTCVDYFGFWKAKMYAINRCFNNLLISAQDNGGWVSVSINSDYVENQKVDFYFKLYNTDGRVFWRRNYYKTDIIGKQNQNYFTFNLSRELGLIGRENAVFKIEIYSNQEMVSEYYYIFTDDKNLKLKPPVIQKKIFKVSEGYVIELTTDFFARHVLLFTDKKGILSDNYFNILPGETKKVYFYTTEDIYGIESVFKTISYTDVYSYSLFIFK